MRPNPVSSFNGISFSDKVSLDQLHRCFPPGVILKCLEDANNATERNRELPNHFVFYYLLSLCLHRNVSQKEVLRRMTDGITWRYGLVPVKITGRSGISQAKGRVSPRAMKGIFNDCAKPIAKPNALGCFFKCMRIVVVDGSDIDLYDSNENAKYFGKSSNQHGECGYPKARAVALLEAGTRTVFGLAVGKFKITDDETKTAGRKPSTRKCKEVGEIALALTLTHNLKPDMILLADRLFMAFELFKKCRQTGANLLFRAREDRNLKKEEILPDGSYYSTIYDSRSGSNDSLKVRVIEFTLEVTANGVKEESSYRLITTLMDHVAYPLDDLAKLYRERWEVETMFDEVKNHLMEGELLRSRTPELVEQEVYAMVMASNVIRHAMYDAADFAKLDPDILSYTHSKNVVERYLPKFGSFPPSAVV